MITYYINRLSLVSLRCTAIKKMDLRLECKECYRLFTAQCPLSRSVVAYKWGAPLLI